MKEFAFLLTVTLLSFLSSPGLYAQKEIPVTTKSEEARKAFVEGRDLYERTRGNEARAKFDQAVKLDPKFAQAYLYRSYTTNSTSEWRKYVDLAIANKATASKAEQLLVDLSLTGLANDLEKALDLMKQLVEICPESPRARLRLAGVYSGMNEIARSREILKEALDLDPLFALTRKILATSYMVLSPVDLSEAEIHMRKYVELLPEDKDAHYSMGSLFLKQQKLEDARAEFLKASELSDHRSAMAFGSLAQIESLAGHYDSARSYYHRAVDVAVGSDKINYANACSFTYLYAGQVPTALRENRKILDNLKTFGIPADQLDNARMSLFFNRFIMAAYFWNFDDAQESLAEHANILEVLLKAAKSPEAARMQQINHVLMESFLEIFRGNYPAAEAKAEEFSKLAEPLNNPRKMEDYHFLMGLSKLKQKQYQSALDHFLQADKNGVFEKFCMAEIMEGLGRREEAKNLYGEVSRWNTDSLWLALVRSETMRRLQKLAN